MRYKNTELINECVCKALLKPGTIEGRYLIYTYIDLLFTDSVARIVRNFILLVGGLDKFNPNPPGGIRFASPKKSGLL